MNISIDNQAFIKLKIVYILPYKQLIIRYLYKFILPIFSIYKDNRKYNILINNALRY